MELQKYLQMMERREPIKAGTPAHELMHRTYEESQRISKRMTCMKKKMNFLFLWFMLVIATAAGACGTDNDTLLPPEPPVEESGNEDDTSNNHPDMNANKINITAGDTTLTATLVDNSSTRALKELLAKGELTIRMSDYGSMEKVGPIGTTLPRNDEYITTQAGDLILYQGSNFVIYYDTNAWSLTRLGHIEGATREGLLSVFGDGDVTVTLSLSE